MTVVVMAGETGGPLAHVHVAGLVAGVADDCLADGHGAGLVTGVVMAL